MLNPTLLYVIPGIILLSILWKFPEVCFALFLTAGLFKATPQLHNILPKFFDLTVFFGAVVVLAILINILKKNLRIPRIHPKLFLPYIGMAILMFLSLTYTSSPIYGTDKFLKFITFIALATFAPIFLFKNETILKRFFYTIISVSTLTNIVALIVGRRIRGEAVLAFSADYLTLGIISGMGVLIILFYFIRGKNIKKQLLWFIILLINLVGLVYSSARAPIFVLIFTVILMLLFSFNIKTFRISKSALLFFILIVFLISLSFLFFPELTKVSLGRIKGIFLEMGNGLTPIEERLGMFSVALRGLYLYPLLGVGVGGYSTFAYKIDQTSYPHNMLLEAGSELGIFGLFLLILFIGFCFFRLLHLKKNKPERYILINTILALFIFMFLDSLVNGSIISTGRLFFVWIGTAYALNNILRSQKLEYLRPERPHEDHR